MAKPTVDGIPVVEVSVAAASKEGLVTFVSKDQEALDTLPDFEASDGRGTYLVVEGEKSLLVRGGVVHEKPFARYGIAKGGCGAARDGSLLLAGVAPSGEEEAFTFIDGQGNREQRTRPGTHMITVSIGRDGKEVVRTIPRELGQEERCRAWLEADGTFALALFKMIRFDGARFVPFDAKNKLGWATVRTVMGSAAGPRFCFGYCNADEQKETHPQTESILRALDFRSGPTPEWIAMGNLVAGGSKGRVVRAEIGGPIETLDGVPDSNILNGALDLAFTEKGDVVIALDYRFRKYIVWPKGQKGASPVRTLGPGETMAHASPTQIVRGLTSPLPPAQLYAVLIGASTGLGSNGATLGYQSERHGPDSHRARFDRAKKVLGKGRFVGAHEAIVDLDCGAFVRSPWGWEGERPKDWAPPVLPALSPKAVTRPPSCLPLEKVVAVPGDPDFLLGLSKGKLYGAWLPEPLPLPLGRDMRDDGPPPKAPVQNPRPGVTWFEIGPADSIAGDDGQPEPGDDTAIPSHSWMVGGGAVVTVGTQSILVTGSRVFTLPGATTPMAIETGSNPKRAWGAIGKKLVVCADACRAIDLGVASDIVAVVPRTDTGLVVTFADGRRGVVDPPATGGETTPEHGLAGKLRDALGKRP